MTACQFRMQRIVGGDGVVHHGDTKASLVGTQGRFAHTGMSVCASDENMFHTVVM